MSTRTIGSHHPATGWVAPALFTLFLVLMPTIAAAQGFGGGGMMGRGSGPSGGGGYGMMGGSGSQPQYELTLAQAEQYLKQSAASAQVDPANKRVTFTGDRLFIAIAAVQPDFPDTTFEAAGLVNPTIEVPAGARITLLFVNMDYGSGMSHGVVITELPPPYQATGMMGMMGMGQAIAGIPVLPPRDREAIKSSHYAAGSITFTAPRSSGTYYYLCQYEDHAAKGMYGRFVVR